MRECGSKGQSVQDLRHARPGLMGLFLVAPVARGQRVLEAVRDGAHLEGQLHVEVFALVDKLLSVESHLFDERPEKTSE